MILAWGRYYVVNNIVLDKTEQIRDGNSKEHEIRWKALRSFFSKDLFLLDLLLLIKPGVPTMVLFSYPYCAA